MTLGDPAAQQPQQTITDTNDGFIVGADPKQPPRITEPFQATDPQGGLIPDGSQNAPGTVPTFTAEDVTAAVARARQEEKDKLYGRITTMDEQLKTLSQEREEREAAARAAQEAADTEARRREEEQMEVRDLLTRRDEEWTSRLQEIQDQYDQDRAVFERERRFQALEEYRTDRVAQEAEWIMPELRDLIKGNSETDIDASIEEMKQRTALIVGQFTDQQTQMQRGMRMAAPTAPPVGPLEQMQQYESLTPADIGSMDMETYKKHRERLLQAASQQYRGG